MGVIFYVVLLAGYAPAGRLTLSFVPDGGIIVGFVAAVATINTVQAVLNNLMLPQSEHPFFHYRFVHKQLTVDAAVLSGKLLQKSLLRMASEAFPCKKMVRS